jgi:hypothetical protein
MKQLEATNFDEKKENFDPNTVGLINKTFLRL